MEFDTEWDLSDIEIQASSADARTEPQNSYSTPVEICASDLKNDIDIQGIDWSQMSVTREEYRRKRTRDYRGNYTNLTPHPHKEIRQTCAAVIPGSIYYAFRYAKVPRRIPIVHFQLRNLLWAANKNEIYYAGDSSVLSWSPIAKRSSTTLDLRLNRLQDVRISTMCAKLGILMLGGFNGEYVLQRPSDGIVSPTKDKQRSASSSTSPSASSRYGRATRSGFVTTSYNGITNHIDIAEARQGTINAIISSNDEFVRIMNLDELKITCSFKFPWAVNCSTLSPDKRMLCVVGDDRETLIADAQSGEILSTLRGHADYSFACAWSPCGRIVATGNQGEALDPTDKTSRLYDVRNMSRPFCLLRRKLSAIRSIRFSDDGKFMAMAEAADFVHVLEMARLHEILEQGDHLVPPSYTPPEIPQYAHSYAQPMDVDEEEQDEIEESSGGDSAANPSSSQPRIGGHDLPCQIIDFFGEISGISFTPGDGEQLYIGNAHESYGCILEYERTRPSIGNLDSMLV
ncbi:hypothetical protein SmJEL517_g03251 [Synchytrium microbalum]|uniref:DUF2415 domain-containing protein n=1 Tax=Synchytrium microbalum TaxID=1806994 RepID=A0A507C3V8_9FUNG|nr:uncharacterized protein SmJEL517_g03251 [Synchytrium microbalum]TPX34068.1 hypothetical protein SmJEL517_g03251 [Synchytrium microbalum]